MAADEDQAAEICKEPIQTFNAKWLGQDTLLSPISRPENVTSQSATFNPLATTQKEPSEVPQDSEFLGGAFGNSPSTSSVGSSPDSDTEPPLFASIRRILSADPSYAAEDVISAIEKRSGGKTFVLAGSGSEPAIIEGLISEAPAGQESTSQGAKKRPTTSGGSKSQANKKQKTRTPSDADEDDEDGSGSNSDEDGDDKGSGGGGGGGDGTPRHTRDESFEGWICPYCLETHLERYHSPKSKLENVKKSLPQYFMSAKQWGQVKKLKTERPQKEKDFQKWLQVQKTWYQDVWKIIFPNSQYVPDSPFHTTNEALKERCHQVVEAMLGLECERAQARDCSSREDTQLFTRLQVKEMLEKALQIGSDSLPFDAQHFGKRKVVEATHTEPQTSGTATTPEDEVAGPTPNRSDGVTPNSEGVAAETEGTSTPENTLSSIPKAVTPQPCPFQVAVDAQQIPLHSSSEVPLENNGQSIFISIELKPKKRFQATGQTLVGWVQVTAPSVFSINIKDVRDLDLSDL
ncbi:hypothetical protein N8I77_008269 [Diaporthe amygdali]|uniref:Uncharacterized protein n=1 Tax=Phomopsis amygdali TaxID=1214568 RepID=A0AAD9SDT6_PHOAM|nr:hypothetical protein N8I77_008269 [Diaporthe amygdali]